MGPTTSQWSDPSVYQSAPSFPPAASIPDPRPATDQPETPPKQERPKPPRRPRPGNLTEQEQNRVDRAAGLCHDLLVGGWFEDVADQAQKCITDKTWSRLFGKRRDYRVLAEMALNLLEGEQTLDAIIGSLAGRVPNWIGGQALECAVVQELTARIPIPGLGQKATVVARCLQMIGILLCLNQGLTLEQCRFFIDLALAETNERRVRTILVAATEDWTNPSSAMLAI